MPKEKRKKPPSRGGDGGGGREEWNRGQMPWASMALATLTKPAMFAPMT